MESAVPLRSADSGGEAWKCTDKLGITHKFFGGNITLCGKMFVWDGGKILSKEDPKLVDCLACLGGVREIWR